MLKHVTVLGASAIALAMATSAHAQDANTVIAKVGDVEITLGEMIMTRAQLPQQYEQFPPEVLFEGILDQLIQQQLLSNEADGSSLSLQAILKNQTRSARANETVSTLSESAVTEEALQQAYEDRYGDAELELEWNASHLLVDTEEEAIAAKERVTNGEEFADVARDVSTGPSGPTGGSLGWFGKGRMVPAFELATSELAVGEVSDPVQTQFGWHVIILNELRELPPPTIEDVRSTLFADLQEDAVQALLAQLETEYEVERILPKEVDPSFLTNFDLLNK